MDAKFIAEIRVCNIDRKPNEEAIERELEKALERHFEVRSFVRVIGLTYVVNGAPT